jgi:hypothetical protein
MQVEVYIPNSNTRSRNAVQNDKQKEPDDIMHVRYATPKGPKM